MSSNLPPPICSAVDDERRRSSSLRHFIRRPWPPDSSVVGMTDGLWKDEFSSPFELIVLQIQVTVNVS